MISVAAFTLLASLALALICSVCIAINMAYNYRQKIVKHRNEQVSLRSAAIRSFGTNSMDHRDLVYARVVERGQAQRQLRDEGVDGVDGVDEENASMATLTTQGNVQMTFTST
jgi:hypothetical protein